MHTLVCLRASRQQYFGTLFLRNCPALELMRRLVQQKASCATLRIAVLACSIGAEVYSILWTLRQARPDLNIVLSAVDISKEMLDFAEKGVYGPSSSELVGAPIFERLTAHDKRQMFDWEGDQATVKSWLRKGMAWRLADATDPELSRALGMQDIVVANNFLCHMAPADAEKCLRNIVQLVAPGGFLFISGVDLDIRTKVAVDLGWKPVTELIAEIHDGDPSVRTDWPWYWWGLEPLNRKRHDWQTRYAAAFRIVSSRRQSMTRSRDYALKPTVLKKRERKPKKIALFGHFNSTNFGNESTLQAVLYNLRWFEPDAQVMCICTGPEITAATYHIEAIPLADTLVRRWVARNPVMKVLRKVCAALTEPYAWIKGFIRLRQTEMLIIPGTGLLTDACGLLHWGPYNLFKWSLIAKFSHCKLLLVSVGAGPLYGSLGRCLTRVILFLADFRSYRDISSLNYLASIGLTPHNDPVYPDLAFSLPGSAIPRRCAKKSGRPVIGLGVMEYAGKYSVARPSSITYQNYLDTLVSTSRWLLANGYAVRLTIGDILDLHAKEEFRQLLREKISAYDNEKHVIDEPICSFQDLLTQLSATDVVVATRFHNIVLALLSNKPVVAISFHHKCSDLMNAMGLSKYCLDINDLTAAKLIEQICDLETNKRKIKSIIREKTKEFRAALHEQYMLIAMGDIDGLRRSKHCFDVSKQAEPTLTSIGG